MIISAAQSEYKSQEAIEMIMRHNPLKIFDTIGLFKANQINELETKHFVSVLGRGDIGKLIFIKGIRLKDNILIIGGGGFVGMHLAKFLIKNRDCFLTLADFEFGRNISDYFDANDLEKDNFIKNDFTNYQAFEDLNKDFKYVYMLASVVGVNNTLDSPEKVIKTNTSLILNCAEWIKESNVKRLLFTSTSEAYSGTTEVMDYKIPTDERVPLCIADVSDPRFSYAITKILGESIFLNYSKKYSFESTIVRYHNAFGPDMGFKHVIPHLVERFLNQEDPFRMFGFDQTRSFSYIDDTVLGTVLAMESNKVLAKSFILGQ